MVSPFTFPRLCQIGFLRGLWFAGVRKGLILYRVLPLGGALPIDIPPREVRGPKRPNAVCKKGIGRYPTHLPHSSWVEASPEITRWEISDTLQRYGEFKPRFYSQYTSIQMCTVRHNPSFLLCDASKAIQSQRPERNTCAAPPPTPAQFLFWTITGVLDS